MESVTLKTRSLRMSDEEFFDFCAENRDLRIERNSKGDIIIMTPTGLESGNRGNELNAQVHNWNK